MFFVPRALSEMKVEERSYEMKESEKLVGTQTEMI